MDFEKSAPSWVTKMSELASNYEIVLELGIAILCVQGRVRQFLGHDSVRIVLRYGHGLEAGRYLWEPGWVILVTTLRNRSWRTVGKDPSSQEFKKSSASTPVSAPKIGAMSSGVIENRVDVMDCADDFRVSGEAAQDAIAYLKPAWMYSAGRRGPSKITFMIYCRKISRAPEEKVDLVPSGGAAASRREIA
jgi:hypothetical protein